MFVFLGIDEIPFDFTSMIFCNFFLWEVVFIRDTAACKCYGCNGQFVESHQRIHHQLLMTYSYGGGNIECTERKVQQKCALPKWKNLFITSHLRLVCQRKVAMVTFWCQRTLQANFKLPIGRYFGGSLDSPCELCGSRIPDDVYSLFYEHPGQSLYSAQAVL